MPSTRPFAPELARQLQVSVAQVEATAALIEKQNTVPFIVRYRQEATGGLGEPQAGSP